jgi:hypothetical protein
MVSETSMPSLAVENLRVYGRLTDQPTNGRVDWLTKILAPAEFQDAIVAHVKVPAERRAAR